MLDPLTLIGTALKIVGTVADVIPGAKDVVGKLAGPKAGDAAKAVIDGAKAVFGTDDPKVIEAKAAADRAATERLVAQWANDLEVYKAELADTADARARDIAVRQANPHGVNTRANVMLVGAFLCLVVIIVGTLYYRTDIPEGVAAILYMACGQTLQMLIQAFNFEFGSSRGSADKAGQLSEMMRAIKKS